MEIKGKLRDIKNGQVRRHVKLTVNNMGHRKEMLHTGNGTSEQLSLARTCLELDRQSIRFLKTL